MRNIGWKAFVVSAVVAFALLATVPQANAHWWGTYTPEPWGCCNGFGYASYGYTSGSWYLGWRPGPVRRLLLGHCRWYWAGCCTTCWDNCCGFIDPCCDGSVTPAMPLTPAQPTPAPARTPAQPPAVPQPTPATPQSAEPTPRTTQVTPPETSGVLTVWVPYNAKVTVNGHETKSTGSRRQFISYGLTPGFSYKYVVHATIVRDGQTQEDTRTIVLKAGDVTAVAFGFNAMPTEQVASR